MSEEFECTPDVAVNLPFGLCTRILSLRDYANARSIVENAEKPEDVKQTPGIEKVLEIQAERAIALMDSRKEA